MSKKSILFKVLKVDTNMTLDELFKNKTYSKTEKTCQIEMSELFVNHTFINSPFKHMKLSKLGKDGSKDYWFKLSAEYESSKLSFEFSANTPIKIVLRELLRLIGSHYYILLRNIAKITKLGCEYILDGRWSYYDYLFIKRNSNKLGIEFNITPDNNMTITKVDEEKIYGLLSEIIRNDVVIEEEPKEERQIDMLENFR